MITALLLGLAAPAAGNGHWNFNFNQGQAEYAVGSFADGQSNLALYCSEAGIAGKSVSVYLNRAGFTPTGPTPATFTTETGSVTLTLDKGSVSYKTVDVAPRFRDLWRLLGTGKTLKIAYGPGAPMQFPLTGAAKLLTPKVCPKQIG